MLSLFLPVFILVAAGLVMLSGLSLHLFLMQLIWIALGGALILLFLFIDWRSVFNFRWVIWGCYGLGIMLMVVAYLHGPIIRNTRSWLSIGSITIQPVELVKIAIIFLYANYFSRRHLAVARWQTILSSFLFFVIPAGIATALPDLGSAVILGGIWFGFLLLSGLPLRRIAVGALIFLLAAGFIWAYVFKDYHRARIVGYFSPQQSSLGVNYSTIQSRIAIGSAGFWGKGYGQGTQAQLGFLSEPTKDFILSALIEEWGIAGGLFIIAVFLFLIFRMLKIGLLADKNFEKFICLGAATMFGMQFLLNAGSATGLIPVVGVTFPFLSYGGSSMIVDFFLLAVINSVRQRSRGSS